MSRSIDAAMLVDRFEECLGELAALKKTCTDLESRVAELEEVIFEPTTPTGSETSESSDVSHEVSISLTSSDTTLSGATPKKERAAPKRSFVDLHSDVKYSSDEETDNSPPSPPPVAAPLKRSASLRAPARISSLVAASPARTPPRALQKPRPAKRR